jgi:hypothetical protein
MSTPTSTQTATMGRLELTTYDGRLTGYPTLFKEMTAMHWFGMQLLVVIGGCYAVAMEQAIISLPYDALDAA